MALSRFPEFALLCRPNESDLAKAIDHDAVVDSFASIRIEKRLCDTLMVIAIRA